MRSVVERNFVMRRMTVLYQPVPSVRGNYNIPRYIFFKDFKYGK
jgi:hypothetical protein